ncbi:MAG: hypothetical protein ACFFDO_07400 [Candidatus Thorarchaeota archaeon]
MTSITPMGFCSHCQQNVLLHREPIDALLAIILFCCTFGIGFFIYLIIYYSRPENRCVHCGTEVSALLSQDSQVISQLPYQQQTQYSQVKTIESDIVKYCPLCGGKLDSQYQNFCPTCGSKI